jgi:hypothetical protein
MSSEAAYNTPTETNAIEGEVVLLGPNGVAVSMTPEAAEETGRRLIRSAEAARRQREQGSVTSPEE